MSSFQMVVISTGILSVALLFKISVPLVIDFSVNQAPGLWISFSSWLKPPYLYLILNCIIITIAASARFHYSADSNCNHDDKHQHEIPAATKPSDHYQFHSEMNISTAPVVEAEFQPGYEDRTLEEPIVAEVEKVSADAFEDKSTSEVEDDFVLSRSTWIPSKRVNDLRELLVLPDEKPLVSARFGHRKPVKASPEGGRALRVAKPKRQETLENTWKMITEGRPMPLTRHLKKSDTFDCRGRAVTNVGETESRLPKKSETLKDRTNYQLSSVSSGNSPASKLRKEPSLSQDELNKRVEAFIKKFNDEMRLQRQQSLNQYKEMISR